jgi:hypothetical protein
VDDVLVEEIEVLSDDDDDELLVEAELLVAIEELVLIALEVLWDVVVVLVLVEVPRLKTNAAAPMTTTIITMIAITTR